MIKLSIIIPAYNVSLWIESTIQSVYRSEGIDLSTIEVIVVNDGSTDDTAKVVEAFVEAHPEMSIRMIQQENQGVSAARNRGLKDAKGEYVWFVDGDDLITPNAVHNIFSIIGEHPGVDVIKTALPVKFFNVIPSVTSSSTQGETKLCMASELFREPYSGLYIYHGRHIWRRELLVSNGIGYPVGIVINEDFCFTIQALLKADTACDAPGLQAYLYRKHDDSATGVRNNPEKFMPRVESGLQALQLILASANYCPIGACPDADERKCNQRRVCNLMIAMNITHILDPLPLSFVRRVLKKLEEMGAYPFTPEPDHSALLRFVMQHKWAIYAVSQYRRLMLALQS